MANIEVMNGDRNINYPVNILYAYYYVGKEWGEIRLEIPHNVWNNQADIGTFSTYTVGTNTSGRWTIPSSFFNASGVLPNLIQSGSGGAYDKNHHELFRFTVEDKYNPTVLEYIDTHVYCKPRNKVTNVTTALGTVNYDVKQTITWSYPSSVDDGIPNAYRVRVINANDPTNVQISRIVTTKSFVLDTSILAQNKTYNLEITAGRIYDNQFYYFTDAVYTYNNYVTRYLIPVKKVSNVTTLGTVKDETERIISWSYTNSTTNGTANGYFVRLIRTSGGQEYTDFFQYASTNSVIIPVTSLELNTQYTLKITPYYEVNNVRYVYGGNFDNTTTCYVKTNYVNRNPTPSGGTVVIQTTVGTIRDEQNRTVSFYYLSGTNTGLANRYVYQIKNASGTVVYEWTRASASTAVNASSPASLQFPVAQLSYTAKYSLTIIPCYYDASSDTELRGASSTWGVQNNIYRDPTPTKAPSITKGWGIVRDEQNKNLTIKYTSSQANGIANVYRFIITDMSDSSVLYDSVISMPFTLNTATSSDFTVRPTHFPIKHTLAFRIYMGFRISNDNILWGNNFYDNDNAMFRNPTPVAKVNNVQYRNDIGSMQSITIKIAHYTPDSLYLKWDFTSNASSYGIANRYRVTLLNANDDSVIKIRYATAKEIEMTVLDVPIGIPVTITIQPIFRDSSVTPNVDYLDANYLYTATSVFTRDRGLRDLVRIAPRNDVALWFKPPTNTPPTFKIAFNLPEELNPLTQEEKEAYRYKKVEVIINDSYKYSTDAQPACFGLTDSHLGYMSTVIFSLENSLTIPVARTQLIETMPLSTYNIKINVTSQHDYIKSATLKIGLVDFPISIYTSEDNNTGTIVRASRMNEFLKAGNILKSFVTTDSPLVYNWLHPDCTGQPISYSGFDVIMDSLYEMYSITASLNNTMKFAMPMKLLASGTAPLGRAYAPEEGNNDYVYENTNTYHTEVTPLSNKPADYDANYNNYYQISESFTFHSPDNTFKADLVYSSSTGDTNVFNAYYRMLLWLAKGDPEPTGDEALYEFINGTTTRLTTNPTSIKGYGLAYLSELRTLTIGGDVSVLPNYFNQSSTSIETLVLQYPDGVVQVTRSQDITNSRITTVKVPADLVDAYMAHSVWGTRNIVAI